MKIGPQPHQPSEIPSQNSNSSTKFRISLQRFAKNMDKNESSLSVHQIRRATTPEKLIEIQTKVYEYNRSIEMAAKLTNSALDGIKQVLRSQS